MLGPKIGRPRVHPKRSPTKVCMNVPLIIDRLGSIAAARVWMADHTMAEAMAHFGVSDPTVRQWELMLQQRFMRVCSVCKGAKRDELMAAHKSGRAAICIACVQAGEQAVAGKTLPIKLSGSVEWLTRAFGTGETGYWNGNRPALESVGLD